MDTELRTSTFIGWNDNWSDVYS